MKRRLFLLTAIFCLLSANITTAQETEGYLVKLKPTAAITIEHEDGYMLDQLKYAPQYIRVESMEELEQYIGMENVEYVEPRCELELFDIPNDPYYDEQWGYTDLRAEYACSAGVDGEGIRVAVIDSGISRSHEDFETADIETGENFARISEEDDTVIADDLTDFIGHGTAVASVIVAQNNNGVGMCGIAPGVSLVPFRVFSAEESFLDWAVQAIYAAVDEYDCDIINMSFGLPADRKILREAVQYAHDNGVILVASVGNDYGTEIFYPAAYDEVIGVGAVGEGREHAAFSQRNESVYITAPGEDMVTADFSDDSSYIIQGGTSFSSPVIAGMAALALQTDSSITPNDFSDLLKELAQDLGDTGWDAKYGHGIVEIETMLKNLGVSLQAPDVKSENKKTMIYGHFEGMTPLERKTVVIGGYDANGRLCSLDMQEYTVDKLGVMTIEVIFERARSLYERISLFRMEGDIPVPVADVMELI